jgi:colanic acid/amylovoran biosynthesis glycosyltransferase
MKVVFCTYDFANYYNGPNSWMRRLLPQLRSRGVEIRVFFIKPAEAGPAFDDLTRQGFDCPHFDWHTTTQEKIAWILEQVAHWPPDILLANLVVPAYYAGRWIREAGIPTVGILHTDDAFYLGIVAEFVLGDPRYRASAMICVSKWQKNNLECLHPENTIVDYIPYGTPIPSDTARQPTDRLRLVYTGRFVETQKRVSDLTRALCRAMREVPGTEAVLYGGGEARMDLIRIIKEERATHVHLAGIVDAARIQDELLACHAFALLSDFEGLPISLLEAMACGVVPICLKIRSGVPELIEHDVTGLIVDDRGDDFVKAIRRLRADPDLWARLSRGARTKIARNYASATVADDWIDLFNRLAGCGRRTRLVPVPSTLELPAVHPELACEDFRNAAAIVGPRFSSEDFLAAGARRR